MNKHKTGLEEIAVFVESVMGNYPTLWPDDPYIAEHRLWEIIDIVQQYTRSNLDENFKMDENAILRMKKFMSK